MRTFWESNFSSDDNILSFSPFLSLLKRSSKFCFWGSYFSFFLKRSLTSTFWGSYFYFFWEESFLFFFSNFFPAFCFNFYYWGYYFFKGSPISGLSSDLVGFFKMGFGLWNLRLFLWTLECFWKTFLFLKLGLFLPKIFLNFEVFMRTDFSGSLFSFTSFSISFKFYSISLYTDFFTLLKYPSISTC